ncbi:MAG TPA: hypothetical protein DEP17_01630 [Lachnospiraceae bacterium]|jgi:hypothetical protein|nr:hypothetical protein [Lachnospiraceae bacterium]
MISGAVLAAILISAAAFSSIKARKSSPNSIDDNSIDNRMLEAAQEEMPEDTLNALYTDEAAAEDSWEITDEITSEIEALIQKYYTVEDLNEEVLVSDTEKEQKKAKQEITAKRDGIESYQDIKVIIRKGLEKDTYIAFTTYKTRFINIETLAPGMSVLYIVPNEEGKLGVQDLPKDKNLEEHINDLLAEKEIAAMVEKVNAGFSKAIDKDENLKTFVEKLSEEAKQGSQKNKK